MVLALGRLHLDGVAAELVAQRGHHLHGPVVLALLAMSAVYGQKGDLDSVVKLLQPHEAKMTRDVRLANNYFEALFQSRQIEKVTKLLNALAEQGKAIVMISSELPEVLRLSHRILVMCEGRVTGEIPGRGATQERIMQLATQRESMTAT